VDFTKTREPCSFNRTVHYSYDYAQQLHYPSDSNQPGPIYFKTPSKCAIFGVCCEAIPRQVNFLIDENVLTGKGANSTISYMYYFFKRHGLNINIHKVIPFVICFAFSEFLPNVPFPMQFEERPPLL